MKSSLLFFFVATFVGCSLAYTELYELVNYYPPGDGVPKNGNLTLQFNITNETASYVNFAPGVELWVDFEYYFIGRKIQVTWYNSILPSVTNVTTISGNDLNTTLPLTNMNCSNGCVVYLVLTAICDLKVTCFNGLNVNLAPRVYQVGSYPTVYAYDFNSATYNYPWLLENSWTRELSVYIARYLYFRFNNLQAQRTMTFKMSGSYIKKVSILSGGTSNPVPTESGTTSWAVIADFPANRTVFSGVNYFGVEGVNSLVGPASFSICVGDECTDGALTIAPLLTLLFALYALLF